MEFYNYDYSHFEYPKISELDWKTILYLFTKRSSDILLSLSLLILSLAILVLIFIVIGIFNRVFPIYVDKRIGQHGKPLNVLKFRTMVKDAETNIDKYLTEEQKNKWEEERKLENDPRTTRIGRFLRKSSLDELPQLINILIGNMAFVGPRPIIERELLGNFTQQEAYKMLSVKPGATGNWQVYGRSTDSWANGARKKLILQYVDTASFLTDTKIFLLTIPACIKFFIEETIRLTKLDRLIKGKKNDRK